MSEIPTRQIAGDEIVYRRVPVKQNYYQPDRDYLSAAAFRPTPRDATGISLSRARLMPGPQAAAARGYENEQYWIIEFRVSELLKMKATVIADDPQNPSHAIVPELRTEKLKSKEADELMHALTQIPRVVHGPHPGSVPKPKKPENEQRK